VGLDAVEKKIYPCEESNPDCLARRLVSILAKLFQFLQTNKQTKKTEKQGQERERMEDNIRMLLKDNL
jgi:hypothetical protein